jgi:hypothetical protein
MIIGGAVRNEPRRNVRSQLDQERQKMLEKFGPHKQKGQARDAARLSYNMQLGDKAEQQRCEAGDESRVVMQVCENQHFGMQLRSCQRPLTS